MLNKILSLLIAALLINVAAISPAQASPRAQDDKQARAVEKVRENVRKLGVGEAARVELRLIDGRKLKGHIREAGEDTFVVVEEKSGAAITVIYAEVTQIKGRNRLTAAKVGLTIAKGVAVVAAVAGIFTLFAFIVVSQTK